MDIFTGRAPPSHGPTKAVYRLFSSNRQSRYATVRSRNDVLTSGDRCRTSPRCQHGRERAFFRPFLYGIPCFSVSQNMEDPWFRTPCLRSCGAVLRDSGSAPTPVDARRYLGHAAKKIFSCHRVSGMSIVAPISMWSDGSGSVGNGPGTEPLPGSGITDATLIVGDKKR